MLHFNVTENPLSKTMKLKGEENGMLSFLEEYGKVRYYYNLLTVKCLLVSRVIYLLAWPQ